MFGRARAATNSRYRYRSGGPNRTTGTPKGVMHTYFAPAALMENEKRNNDLKIFAGTDHRFFSYLPLNHIAERVIVEIAPNRFVPRPVSVAYESAGMAAVSCGLSAGERVVTSGQFMLDSEASLRGELERISAGDGSDQSAQDEDDPHAGHRH